MMLAVTTRDTSNAFRYNQNNNVVKLVLALELVFAMVGLILGISLICDRLSYSPIEHRSVSHTTCLSYNIVRSTYEIKHLTQWC